MRSSLKRKNTGLRGLLCAAAAFVAVGTVGFATSVSETPENFNINPDGSFTWVGARWSVISYNSKWQTVNQDALKTTSGGSPEGGISVEEGKWTFRVSGVVPAVGSRGDRVWTLDEHLRHLSENTIGVNYRVSFPDKVDGESAAMVITIPISGSAGRDVEFDGVPLTLPEAKGESPQLFKGRISMVTLPVAGGTLALKCSGYVELQDQRKWGGNNYSLRISFDRARPDASGTPSASIDYSMWVSAKFTPL